MVPLERLPGFAAWGGRLETLLGFDGPLWIWGEPGTGVSWFLRWAGERRAVPVLDDVEACEAAAVAAFLRQHPRGIAGGHLDPEAPQVAAAAAACLAFRLPALEEDPHAVPGLLEAMAAEESIPGPLPSVLGSLPCQGNLRGLRNRILRWKLLGQLPEPPGPDLLLATEAEDLATHLHALERTLLFRALRRSYGNRVEAAVRLGVSRRQLYLLIARHGDPVRGEAARAEAPKRLSRQKNRQNSSRGVAGR